jgi:LysR family transcriptional regulator, hypochlorite-specific transcription factor HypT
VQVGADTLVPVCAPDSEGQPVWPLPPVGDRSTRLLAYSEASGLGRILNALRPDIGGINVETVFTSHLAATLTTMAREGHGFAWLPLTTIREDLGSARLVRAGPERLDVPIGIRLFHSSEREAAAGDLFLQRP